MVQVWFRPDLSLQNSGYWADVWSADHGEYLNLNSSHGNVNRNDDVSYGHSVRLLNTIMHLSDLFQAYFDCRRRKRRTPDAMRFEEHYEANCVQLFCEITNTCSGKLTPHCQTPTLHLY